jgi:hypothetical protein
MPRVFGTSRVDILLREHRPNSDKIQYNFTFKDIYYNYTTLRILQYTNIGSITVSLLWLITAPYNYRFITEPLGQQQSH